MSPWGNPVVHDACADLAQVTGLAPPLLATPKRTCSELPAFAVETPGQLVASPEKPVKPYVSQNGCNPIADLMPLTNSCWNAARPAAGKSLSPPAEGMALDTSDVAMLLCPSVVIQARPPS